MGLDDIRGDGGRPVNRGHDKHKTAGSTSFEPAYGLAIHPLLLVAIIVVIIAASIAAGFGRGKES